MNLSTVYLRICTLIHRYFFYITFFLFFKLRSFFFFKFKFFLFFSLLLLRKHTRSRWGIKAARWIDSCKLNTRSFRILSYMQAFPYSEDCYSAVADSSFHFSRVESLCFATCKLFHPIIENLGKINLSDSYLISYLSLYSCKYLLFFLI